MSRILFVAPRFHTNLFFATKALVEAGHEVEVFVPKREPAEDWSFVTPRIFAPGTPGREIRRAVRDFAPDLALVRHARPVSGAGPRRAGHAARRDPRGSSVAGSPGASARRRAPQGRVARRADEGRRSAAIRPVQRAAGGNVLRFLRGDRCARAVSSGVRGMQPVDSGAPSRRKSFRISSRLHPEWSWTGRLQGHLPSFSAIRCGLLGFS
ncbi:hypothetical protein [Mangrovicoccus ximenensis]|uniref:hypothetical protein n=1 Tax=Mangrovicoccus ximenensis TaxID=1911570 RepID=UPI0011AE1B4D|nr:hypothetical protein [Mangrovicoccus ximenensis]